MENPATWTRATNVILRALREADETSAEGAIGLSTAAFVEGRLREAAMLTPEACEVVGILPERGA